MIFEDMEFHNVSELLESDRPGAYKMLRIPKDVEQNCRDRVAIMNYANCGVEIRFKMIDDEIKIKMCTEGACARPVVFYGNIGAGWEECIKNVFQDETEIVIKKPEKMHQYKQIAKEFNHPFDPEVVRLIFSNTKTLFISKDGRTSPPSKEQLPKKRYLAYGSSITHGSLAISQLNAWTYRVAQALDSDLINLGIAGGAAMEEAMADYISSRNDWDFATFEMGINVLSIEPEDYRRRIEYFISKVAVSHPNKKIFCIDVFYCEDDFEKRGKALRFRTIMNETLNKLNLNNTIYINGLEIMDGAWGLSGDLVHPNAYACEIMGERISEKIKSFL